MTGQKGDKNIHPILKELLEIKSARDDYDLDVVFAHSAIGCGRFWGEFAGELASFPSSIAICPKLLRSRDSICCEYRRGFEAAKLCLMSVGGGGRCWRSAFSFSGSSGWRICSLAFSTDCTNSFQQFLW